MACRISELVLDCVDAERLAAFWCEVLGYVELDREPDGSIEIGPADDRAGGPRPTLVLSPTGDPRPTRLPLHLDLSPTDRDQAAELARLLALGARPADPGPAGAPGRLGLTDPEGNEFCLLPARVRPGHDGAPAGPADRETARGAAVEDDRAREDHVRRDTPS